MATNNDGLVSIKQRIASPPFVMVNRKPYFPDTSGDSLYENQFLEETLTVLGKQIQFLDKNQIVFAHQKLFFLDLIAVSDENNPHSYYSNADLQPKNFYFDKSLSVSDLEKALNHHPNSFKRDKKEYLHKE